MTQAHDTNIEVSIAVLEERTKVTLAKMGEVVVKLDGLVEQIIDIRSLMPTWQTELARIADRQSQVEARLAAVEGNDHKRDARDGIFAAVARSPLVGWLVGLGTFIGYLLEKRMSP